MTRRQARQFRELIDLLIGKLTSDEALLALMLFKPWEPGKDYEIGDRRREGDKLYRCRQGHTSQAGFPPSMVPALWAEVVMEEWVEWYQKYGEGWPLGAKVTHNGKKWVNSDYPANTWEPGVFGWTLWEEE